jgi:hypothetical protein
VVIGEDAPVGNAEVVAVDRRSRAAEARGGGEREWPYVSPQCERLDNA